MKKIPVRQIRVSAKEESSHDRFNIRRVQDLPGGSDLIQPLHRHDFFFILALEKGKGRHEIDFTSYDISDHSVFMMRPGQVHQLELKEGSAGYLMEFNAAFYQSTEKVASQRLRQASNKNFCALEMTRFDKIQSILTYIFQEYIEKNEGHQEIIKSNLNIFFIELVRQSRNSGAPDIIPSYTQERLEEFLEHLQIHIVSKKKVSQYSALMRLSVYQLNEITKISLGKTPSELISEHIILEAKRYLLATPNQIKDIADQLGYDDPSYFIRFFKKQTGLSPDVFRNNHS